MDEEKCLICNKHKESADIVFRDDIVSISHLIQHPDKSDNYLGYYMVESNRHFRGMYDATDKEMESIGRILKHLSQSLMRVLDAEHVYAFIIGEGLEHFHIHVVARYRNAPREYWGPSVDDWPDAPRGGIQEIRDMNKRMRKELLSQLE